MSAENKKTALERLELLEKQIATLANLTATVQALHKSLQAHEMRLQSLSKNAETNALNIDGIMGTLLEKGLLTRDEVKATVSKQEATRKLLIEESLLQKDLVKESMQVESESFVVLEQTDPETNEVEVARDHIDLARLPDDVKGLFIGKQAGDVVNHQGKNIKILRVLTPSESGQKKAE